MEDAFGKLFGALLVLLAVVFDWPRALAGLLAGFGVRRMGFGYPMVAIVVAVVAIAGLGELIYPLIGRTDGPSWNSFIIGLVSAGATAYGLFRWFSNMIQG